MTFKKCFFIADSDSEYEPFQSDAESDEFIPDNLSEDSENSSEDSSDTDKCRTPKKTKMLQFESINSAINLIESVNSDVAATENKNEDKDLPEEKQAKKKKCLNWKKKLQERDTKNQICGRKILQQWQGKEVRLMLTKKGK